MALRSWLVAGALALGACAPRYAPPPPLPPPPRPLPQPEPEEESVTPLPPPEPSPPAPPAAPRAGAGDASPLQIAFQGCRALGQRIDPQLQGSAILAVRVNGAGRVIAASAVRVDSLPRLVVACLVDGVRRTRFQAPSPRGADLVIPVDFRRAHGAPAAPSPTRTPPPAGTIQL